MIRKHSFSQHDVNTRVSNISRFDNEILTISQSLGVEAPLIKAIIAVESSGNPRAGEGRITGAKGLMQIIKQTWESTIQRFPNVSYRGTRLINFLDREQGEAWADPALSILVGTLTLILKGRSLTKMIGEEISPGDAADAALLLTAYNAGEFTAMKAYKRAVAASSRNPLIDFLQERHLKGAINDVVTRFDLSWNVYAKYKEISEYAGKVLTFLDLFKGTSTFTKPNVAVVNTNTTTTKVHTSNNRHNTKYTIVSGDSGYGIAKKLGVTFSELTKANPSIRWNRLKIGQRINIPVKSNFKEPVATTTPKTKPKVHTTNNHHNTKYTIVSGDSGYGIAKKLGVTFSELTKANPSIRWNRLKIGQRINIPVKSNFKEPVATTTPKTKPVTKKKQIRKYRVQRGETLGIIARKFNISVNQLKAHNPSQLKRWGSVEGFEAGAWISIPV